MIAFVKGKVVETDENLVVIDNNGLGMNVIASNETVYEANSKIGQEISLYTYLAVREDAISLYGFHSKEERNMFKKLILVSGIGPKVAIGILSGITPTDLAVAIYSQDVSKLTSIKGLGKKTAERIIVELKEKVDKADTKNLGQVSSRYSSNRETDDAVFALVALGLGKQEAVDLVASVYEDGDKAEEIITKSLKNMGGSR